MKNKIILKLCILALILFSGCSTSPTGQIIQEDAIKIGFVGPLTGPATEIGIVEKNVVEIAVNEINSKGGIKGEIIKVIYEDGKCTGKEAAIAAQKLINIDKVKIILSVCSSETLAIAPLAEENHVLLITSYAMNPLISGAGDYVFRTGYSDKITAKIIAETIFEDSKTLGIIYEQTDYATALKDYVSKEFTRAGGVVYSESFPQNDKDVRTQLLKILNKNPEAIFVNPDTTKTGLMILKELNELGYQGKVYGNFFGSSPTVIDAPEAEGMIFFGDPDIKENPVKAHLMSEYIKHYREEPSFEYPALSRYDNVYILKQAIEEVGYNPDKIKNYLYQMESYTGALGTYRFDENGDAVGIKPCAKQIKQGRIIPYRP
ncbi:ABC transporter substrate-binding protein [Candidatus Woesearchaeota archaeon]|nr:ABC transporter substrate-binding protein [Candidatus Woesearchaeota archaeon]